MKRLEAKKIKLQFTTKVKKHLAKVGFDPLFGARPLKRAIQREILDLLAMDLIDKKLVLSKKIIFDIDQEKVVIK